MHPAPIPLPRLKGPPGISDLQLVVQMVATTTSLTGREASAR